LLAHKLKIQTEPPLAMRRSESQAQNRQVNSGAGV
jgi:hypothetical protein